MIPSGIMNPPRVKLPLPIIITTICVLLFIAILYAERLSFLSSSSILRYKTCPRKHNKLKSRDSLQRNQWESFVCLVQGIIPEKQKSMKRGRVYLVFKAKEYNATIEFYWAPFLVESNTDIHIIGDPKKRIIKVDEITERAKNWTGVDILVFNTYVWWMSGLRIKALWGSFANGEEGYEELDTPVAYKLGLRTWANWIGATRMVSSVSMRQSP
ncbi:hypothetical protein RIF29_00719 [Crotalaria pallida]|uniref:Trichome birefringence-like C-terminal domain-containing protein n=1 Tax=Crotalaria pallida TaxID=3830 RepID=A0AAN9IWU3_CROPI